MACGVRRQWVLLFEASAKPPPQPPWQYRTTTHPPTHLHIPLASRLCPSLSRHTAVPLRGAGGSPAGGCSTSPAPSCLHTAAAMSGAWLTCSSESADGATHPLHGTALLPVYACRPKMQRAAAAVLRCGMACRRSLQLLLLQGCSPVLSKQGGEPPPVLLELKAWYGGKL